MFNYIKNKIILPKYTRIKYFWSKKMSDIVSLLVRVRNVILALKANKDGLLAENADLKQKLADALAQDAADAQTVAEAQRVAAEARAAADAAAAHTAELQSQLDAVQEESVSLESLVASLEAPAAAPVEAPAAPVEAPAEAHVDAPATDAPAV